MVKYIRILYFFLLASAKLEGQYPFLDYTHVWTEIYVGGFGSYNILKYTLDSNSTLINNKPFYEVFSMENGGPWKGTGIFFRFEDNRVFCKSPMAGEEFIVYDFNLVENDKFAFPTYGQTDTLYEVIHVDTIFLENGEPRKRLELECIGGGWSYHWIEGIGGTYGPTAFDLTCAFDISTYLLCLTRNDTILYLRPGETTCWHLPVGSNEPETEKISFFPNPTYDRVTVLDPDQNIQSLLVTDMFGHIWTYTNDLDLEIKALPPGSYMIVFLLKDGSKMSNKLIKM